MANRIKGLTIEIGGNTVKLEKALKGVNSEISRTQTALRDVDKLLKMNPGNTDLIKQKQQMLGKEIGATTEKLDKLRQAQAQMKENQVDENSEQYQALQREIIETENKLKSLKDEEQKMKFYNLEQAGKKLQAVGDKMKNIGRGMTTYVSAPLAAAGAVGVKKFAEVDRTMQLTNKTMRNTSEQAELLDKAMKDAAANSVYGMNDAATATLNFARAGLDAEEAASTLAPAMNLAAGEGGELDTVSAGLVATINGFGDSFDNAEAYADVFANACNNSALEINSLSDSMSIAAPIFSAAGYSIKDAALYMGVMGNAGIPASEAANSLKTGLARLISPTDEASVWMKELGINITNADGSMKDTVTIQKELHDSFGTLSDSEKLAAASAIFGKNQMSKWIALIETSPDEVEKLSGALEKEGTTAEMADAMMSGFGGSIEKLKSGIDVLATSVGEALAPTIQKVVDKVQKFTDWFNGLDKKQQALIAKIGLIVAALGPLLVIVGTLLSSGGKIMQLIPKLSTSTGLLGKAIGVLTKGPIGWIIAAIALVVAGIATLMKTNENFRNKMMLIFHQLQEAFKPVMDALMQALPQIMDALKPLMPVLAQLLSVIAEIFAEVLTYLAPLLEKYIKFMAQVIKVTAPIVKKIIEILIPTIRLIFEVTKEMIKGIIDAVKRIYNFLKTIFNTIKVFITTTVNIIKAVISAHINAVKTIITTAWNIIKTVVTTVVNAIKAVIQTVFNAIKSFAQNVWNGIKLVIINPIKKAYELIKSVVNAIKTWLHDKFVSIRDMVSKRWDAIKDKMVAPIKKAKDKIKSIIDTIKGWFDNFKLSLPDIPLPHFKIYPEGWKFKDLLKGVKPDLDIEWYAKAMNGGMILNKPTVFGAMNGKLMGGGEAGSETVVGTDSLMTMIQQAVNGAIDSEQLAAAVEKGAYDGTSNITLTLDGRILGRELAKMGVKFA